MKKLSPATLAIACFLHFGCTRPAEPAIEFTKVPASTYGGPTEMDIVEGRVKGARPGQRVVLYALSGMWWVQPYAATPIIDIQADSTWHASIHLGMQYAALLVESTYVPDANLRRLPTKGGPISALAVTKGNGSLPPLVVKTKALHFSGYDWEAQGSANPRGGKTNPYDPDNAWVDQRGFLHLRITRQGNEWACSEVRSKTSLGEGLYKFTVADVSKMDPAATMTLFTWDDGAEDQHHREIDVEVGRWGDPKAKNAQYLIQPFYEPANVFRFEAPAGPLTYSFRWERGRVAFKTVRGTGIRSAAPLVAEHVFSSGVPSAGGESVQMNLYAFGNTRNPMRQGSEVVIEKFEFLP
jgi:hypothetical protein